MNRTKKLKLIAALSMIPIVFLLGLFLFTEENVEILRKIFTHEMTNDQIQAHLRGLGLRGQITVSILSMLQVVIAILPAEPVQVLAGLTYGLWIGVLSCTVGVIAGNTVIFILYKIYGDRMRDYFDKKLEIDLSRVGNSRMMTAAIFILYFLPAIPYGMICFLAATSGMKYPRYIITTTLGAIPSIFIGVGLGHLALETSWILSVAVFAVLVLLLAILMAKKEVIFAKINAFIHKAREPHSSKTTVRKDYGEWKLSIGYFVFRLLTFTKIKLRIKRNVEAIEHPSIVLCNHGAFIDFAYAGTVLKKEQPHFIVARLYYYHKWLARLLRAVGTFPKSMFALDTESAMNCVRVIKSGGVLAMMPEARLSTAGKFEDIQPSTYAFLKKMGVHVYTIKLGGDYLAKPKWATGIRYGSLVEAELSLLFTPEQLSEMSVEEIGKHTEEALRYDEFEWLKEHPELHYRSKRMAEGLENILCRCPSCGAHHSIRTKKNRVFCEKCDLMTEVGDRYAFKDSVPFENFSAWYDWQLERIAGEIEANENYALRAPVELRHASKDGKTLLRLAGNGECTLTRLGLTYVGTEDGETVEKHFSIESIYRLLFGAGEDFEVYAGKEIYYFTPEERRLCVDFYIASKILFDNRKMN
ncbi:MAG: VTT domain-containing protein [Clostridia bacterium]|nr:VTT domain-containing protein [Clostridia bacterium]